MSLNSQPTASEIIFALRLDASNQGNIDLAGRMERLGIDGGEYVGAQNSLRELDKKFDKHPIFEEVLDKLHNFGCYSWTAAYIDFIEKLLEDSKECDELRLELDLLEGRRPMAYLGVEEYVKQLQEQQNKINKIINILEEK